MGKEINISPIPEADYHLIARKRELDRLFNLSPEGIPTFSDEQISTCHHEFGHKFVGEADGLSIEWVSAVPDRTAHPPYLGVTIFNGRATPAMIAAGAVAANSEEGTGGDKHHLNIITEGAGEAAWLNAKISASQKLGPKNQSLWDLASRIFLSGGGGGNGKFVDLAFERAAIELKLSKTNKVSQKREKEEEKLPTDSDKKFRTQVKTLLNGKVEVTEFNLVTGEIDKKEKYACCGGEKVHDPDCKVLKRDLKDKKDNQKVSPIGEKRGEIIFDGIDPYHTREVKVTGVESGELTSFKNGKVAIVYPLYDTVPNL